MVRDPQTGKYRRTRLFVMALGYSRKAARLLVFRSSTRTWAYTTEFVLMNASDQTVNSTLQYFSQSGAPLPLTFK